MTAADPFGLARADTQLADLDPLIALGDEWDALLARMETEPFGPEDDPMGEAAVAVEDRIAALVPTSAAGAVVQLRFLRHYLDSFEWGPFAEQIADNLIDGLREIAARASCARELPTSAQLNADSAGAR